MSCARFIVTLGWILGKPLTLLFDPYESIVLFLSGTSAVLAIYRRPICSNHYDDNSLVLTVNHVVQDGKSNWLEGMILMCLYLILGTTFWYESSLML
jgi:Ca2+:H+ antiporter